MVKSSASKTKDATTPVKESPVETKPVEVVEVAVPTPDKVEESPENNLELLSAEFKKVVATLNDLGQGLKQVTSEVRKLEKRSVKDIREANKKSKKKPAKDINKPKRAPSGFAKPSLISDDLCTFLSRDSGTHMARTEVTKHVTGYIRDQGLQNPANKRQILPDDKLKKLLNANDDDTITYFNLQKFMKHHFPKKVDTSVATSTTSS